ncbi:hypothetical protein [Streptomyces sp. H34-S4]|nr:hypothetical protein [Streptomyces sp. H34-S4]MCY0939636.1 hypothetical protein [Streptomyces sp. H34-S4]
MFNTKNGVIEIAPLLAEPRRMCRTSVEAHVETVLGFWSWQARTAPAG